MKFIAFIAVILLAGCVAPQANNVAPLGNSLSKTQAYVGSASDNVSKSLPHSDATGKALLTSAQSNLQHASTELVAAQQDTTKLNTQLSDQAKTITQDTDKLQVYHKRWTGDRFVATLQWLVISAVAIAVGLGVLSAFAQSNPVVAIVYKIVAGLVTGGLATAHNIAQVITKKVTS